MVAIDKKRYMHSYKISERKKLIKQTKHNYMYIGTTEIQIRALTDVDLFSQFQWLLYKVANRWQEVKLRI
jgi:hypothetical protein